MKLVFDSSSPKLEFNTLLVGAIIREVDHTKGSLIARGRDTKNLRGKG